MNKILINCKENKEFDLSNKVSHTCGNTFELEENNIYAVQTINHFSEQERHYYTMCPNCGYLVLLKEERLTENMKEEAIQKSNDDPLLFRKNELKSQLIYLESITPKVKVRTRINW